MFEGLNPIPPPRTRQIQVKPARPVWVDLGAVFRVGWPRRVAPDGLDLQATVPGELHLWSLTTTGHWVGYVTFAIAGEGRHVQVSQWVLSATLQPRSDHRARPS
ncbi:hypothetical protein [Saccharothrix longispora]|uniref:hypothetical protein n=1 Tax=Saccharothrix longispora TaxID=33920 RepID=UPI0028FDBD73|nr:hypothetical protein [Saccharothrix longispora]MBY8849525.1 hypothetical protein [Saccharothrix sp. MB29]MDU0288658.1 hypothetical protein [Saccharothrix longispora]